MSTRLKSIVEALLFASGEPLGLERLVRVAGEERKTIETAIEELNQDYEASGRAFRVHRIAAGYQLFTLPAYAQWVNVLLAENHRRRRLSRAALETLAIIAYRQPVSKPEIDAGRGVDSSGTLATLLERSLTATSGRAPRVGHPLLYVTSREFLHYFGLNDLSDLPRKEELEDFLRATDERIAGGTSEAEVVAPVSSETGPPTATSEEPNTAAGETAGGSAVPVG